MSALRLLAALILAGGLLFAVILLGLSRFARTAQRSIDQYVSAHNHSVYVNQVRAEIVQALTEEKEKTTDGE